MVLFDTTFLSLLLHPEAKPPLGSDGNPVSRCKDRIENLIQSLSDRKTKIIIPTPVLSEILVLSGKSGPDYLNAINERACFEIKSFDQKAAIEAATQIRDAMSGGDKKGAAGGTWAKAKFDRQIVAIAKVEGVQTIYSDDKDVEAFAKAVGIEVKTVEQLDLPPPKQLNLNDQEAGK